MVSFIYVNLLVHVFYSTELAVGCDDLFLGRACQKVNFEIQNKQNLERKNTHFFCLYGPKLLKKWAHSKTVLFCAGLSLLSLFFCVQKER